MEDRKDMKVKFGELEGDRRTRGNSPNFSQPKDNPKPETEVSTKRRRRSFPKAYKQSILKEIDQCTKPGGVGAILRREGLFYSNVRRWREQLELGKLGKNMNEKERKKYMELAKENRKLQRELNRSKLIIDAQKKILQILDMEDQS